MGLAVPAAGFLLATFVLLALAGGKTSQGRVRKPFAALLAALLLAALALMFAWRPSATTGFPVHQLVLILVSASAFSSALWLRTHLAAEPAQVTDAATVDALTRIASHRVFQDRLAHECERAYRFGDTFVLLMLDLDDFHPVNNRHGHRAGDKILVEVARRLRTQMREIDLVARFGGDQFAMILPHTFESGGRDVSERLRQNVAAWVFPVKEGMDVRLTATVAACCYPEDGSSAPELVEAAQNALRFAKAMGGNQVQLAGDLPGTELGGNVVPLPHSGRGAIVRSLAAAVDMRDGYTHTHSHLVSELSSAIARQIGLPAPDVARIGVGALLHDVGKIGVPDAILTKEGNLSREEWASIREHPTLGKQIIEQAPELTDVVPLVLHHQEHYDGSGYPERLRGDQIPLGARIIAAADAYHAIRSDRPYRSGRTHQEATSELRRCSGRQFDPAVVDALIAILDNDAELRSLQLTARPYSVPAALSQ